jgi:hypothetical protein
MGSSPATVARTGSAKDAVAVSNNAIGDADVTERRQNSSTVGSPLSVTQMRGEPAVSRRLPCSYSIQTTAALLLAATATAAAVIATARPLGPVRVGRVTGH